MLADILKSSDLHIHEISGNNKISESKEGCPIGANVCLTFSSVFS
jgi:hypothetical protein